jgi:hypothetical protein
LSHFSGPDEAVVRRIEDAADALARLDLACHLAPPAFPLALRLAAIGDLAGAGPKGTRALAVTFAGAAPAGLDPELARWADFIEEEERRSRGGAPLTLARLLRAGLSAHVADPHHPAVERALRPGIAHPRPAVLHRALDISATIGDRAFGEAAAALVLCVEGRTDRIRCLPFGTVPGDQREAAVGAWREGDGRAWIELGLEALTGTARGRRAAIDRAATAIVGEDESLAALGRAAISARHALAVLRREFVVTVSSLAGELGLSRPASDDAVARLVDVGLATELTGQKRNRAFAYAAALTITE